MSEILSKLSAAHKNAPGAFASGAEQLLRVPKPQFDVAGYIRVEQALFANFTSLAKAQGAPEHGKEVFTGDLDMFPPIPLATQDDSSVEQLLLPLKVHRSTDSGVRVYPLLRGSGITKPETYGFCVTDMNRDELFGSQVLRYFNPAISNRALMLMRNVPDSYSMNVTAWHETQQARFGDFLSELMAHAGVEFQPDTVEGV